MSTDTAIAIVAQHLIASLVSDAGDEWGSYPEIGEHDWRAIDKRLDKLAPFPDAMAYDEAYALLASRAGDDA